ncbi:MAG: hypothetical protein U0667_17490 [Chloroflexota bacterium]
MPTFTVAWILIGPRLPAVPLAIGNVRIERVDPDRLATLPRIVPRDMEALGSDQMVSGVPGYLKVTSP